MKAPLRQLLIFGPPFLVGTLNLWHPIIARPAYDSVLHTLSWWLVLHAVNLLLFPLLGVSALVLMQPVHNAAALVCRLAIALYIPLYSAFDALAGIGTGALVKIISVLPPDQLVAAKPVVDSFFRGPIVFALGAAGSICWIVAMLAAAVGVTTADRRGIVAVVAALVFVVGGWARATLFPNDGSAIPIAWWVVTLGCGVLLFAVGKPRLPVALFALAGAVFGSNHAPPTGAIGALLFIAAALSSGLAEPRPVQRLVSAA